MSPYWWGLLSFCILIGCLAATAALVIGVWLLVGWFVDKHIVSLQYSESGWHRDRAGEAAYLLAAKKAWTVRLGRWCAVTLSAGKSDPDAMRAMKTAVNQAVRNADTDQDT